MKITKIIAVSCVFLLTASLSFGQEIADETRITDENGRVTSRYFDRWDAEVANQPSPYLPLRSLADNFTLLESRDYGVDLFITGMSVMVAGILGATIPLGAAQDPLIRDIIGPATGSAIGLTGLGLWITGAIYWGVSNTILQRDTQIKFGYPISIP